VPSINPRFSGLSFVNVMQRVLLVNGRGMRLLIGAIAIMLFGCGTTTEQLSTGSPGGKPVMLSAGDVIKISFSSASELNQTQKIRADGKVNLPLVGEVTASGKTLTSLQTELVGLYKSQLKNSDVLVTLESGNGHVVVSGAVSRPGKIEFDRPITVFQAIMEAGGVTQYGTLKKVRVVRTTGGEQHSDVLDLTGTLKGRASPAIYVRDGDVIYVPESAF
jgi:polysaccharide export outer membrane protein